MGIDCDERSCCSATNRSRCAFFESRSFPSPLGLAGRLEFDVFMMSWMLSLLCSTSRVRPWRIQLGKGKRKDEMYL